MDALEQFERDFDMTLKEGDSVYVKYNMNDQSDLAPEHYQRDAQSQCETCEQPGEMDPQGALLECEKCLYCWHARCVGLPAPPEV